MVYACNTLFCVNENFPSETIFLQSKTILLELEQCFLNNDTRFESQEMPENFFARLNGYLT